MKKIKIKKLNPSAEVPFKGSKDAACYDLVATEVIQTEVNKVTVKLGFATEIPVGFKAVIVPRSSFTQKGWVMQNSPGQIDSDYRGEWMIKFEAIPTNLIYKMDNHNRPSLNYADFPYEKEDRVAQTFIEKVEPIYWEEVEELKSSERDRGGFGSTGK